MGQLRKHGLSETNNQHTSSSINKGGVQVEPERPYTYTNKSHGDDIRIVALLCDADLEGWNDDGK